MSGLTVKCKKCRKSPRNCRCFEYRLQGINGQVCLFVDNVATEPVRGESVGTWQTRRNSKVYLRPQFVDSYGPVAVITDEKVLKQVEEAITNGTFYLPDYEEISGIRIRDFDRENKRRLPFLRRARKSSRKGIRVSGVPS